MNWNKEIVFENMEKLNQTERAIFAYVANVTISTFKGLHKYVDNRTLSLSMEMGKIQKEFESYPMKHPFRLVWGKIIEGAEVKSLIHFTEYDDEYKEYAEMVNNLWNISQYHDLVCMILKAFAERDWDELEEKFDGVYDIYEEAQSDIEHSCYTIVDNLDTEDLKTIITFCGGE